MTARLRWFWARLDANYWFYPALFVVGAVLLAAVTLWLDHYGYGAFVERIGPPLAPTPNSAHTMLQIIASAMLGAAATVFSITIAAVAYASGTYGPRLLANFLEDKGNQLSLATLIGTFVYALCVLNSVRMDDDGDPGFVPQISLIGAYVFTALSVGVIVYLLNHIPSSIRINHVLEGIGRRLLDDIRSRFPQEDNGQSAEEAGEGDSIYASGTGYVQLIDFSGLTRLAREKGCTLALEVRTGDFVHRGKALARICGGSSDDGLAKTVASHFTLGAVRTPEQDIQFLFDELVEIGLRALSPGINDPFTAITALHWLGAATAELGQRDLRKREGLDDGIRRVFPLPDDFGHFAARGFGAIRGAVATSPIAARVMLDTLADACGPVRNDKRQAILRGEADAVMELARRALAGPDLAVVETQYSAARARMA
ncbi:MAG TPA: DUF2254 domain-containing protein [Sphingomonadaceae bacterium]|nr:DUF2254 domain-containing protein [Sphingomonadaceae bacterium]